MIAEFKQGTPHSGLREFSYLYAAVAAAIAALFFASVSIVNCATILDMWLQNYFASAMAAGLIPLSGLVATVIGGQLNLRCRNLVFLASVGTFLAGLLLYISAITLGIAGGLDEPVIPFIGIELPWEAVQLAGQIGLEIPSIHILLDLTWWLMQRHFNPMLRPLMQKALAQREETREQLEAIERELMQHSHAFRFGLVREKRASRFAVSMNEFRDENDNGGSRSNFEPSNYTHNNTYQGSHEDHN